MIIIITTTIITTTIITTTTTTATTTTTTLIYDIPESPKPCKKKIVAVCLPGAGSITNIHITHPYTYMTQIYHLSIAYPYSFISTHSIVVAL